MSEAALKDVFAISATYRYVWVAGCAWALYDWIITLGQEIDLVWLRRSGGWQSKFFYGFSRYYGLALIIGFLNAAPVASKGNVIVFMQSNLTADFCRVYFYVWGGTGLVQMSAVQGALLLRVYVMYHRSFKIMTISITLFVIELATMGTIYFINARDYIIASPPAPVTGCSAMSQHSALTKAYWCIGLSFETYMCTLAMVSAYSHWRAAGPRPPNLLTILIRDSLFWYICLAGCLLLNAVTFMTETGILALLGTPALQTIVTIGGPRFLLNLRAAYFSSTRNETSTRTGFKRSMRHSETEGTVGVFRPVISDLKDEGDDRGGNETDSIEMGIRMNSGAEV